MHHFTELHIICSQHVAFRATVCLCGALHMQCAVLLFVVIQQHQADMICFTLLPINHFCLSGRHVISTSPESWCIVSLSALAQLLHCHAIRKCERQAWQQRGQMVGPAQSYKEKPQQNGWIIIPPTVPLSTSSEFRPPALSLLVFLTENKVQFYGEWMMMMVMMKVVLNL